ncbi:MAG: hypothetical protein HYZ71_14715 [Deltaproteobacteria bacterium]|nr:hypothetical protein [Deltaproteobacteria bacterium]
MKLFAALVFSICLSPLAAAGKRVTVKCKNIQGYEFLWSQIQIAFPGVSRELDIIAQKTGEYRIVIDETGYSKRLITFDTCEMTAPSEDGKVVDGRRVFIVAKDWRRNGVDEAGAVSIEYNRITDSQTAQQRLEFLSMKACRTPESCDRIGITKGGGQQPTPQPQPQPQPEPQPKPEPSEPILLPNPMPQPGPGSSTGPSLEPVPMPIPKRETPQSGKNALHAPDDGVRGDRNGNGGPKLDDHQLGSREPRQ